MIWARRRNSPRVPPCAGWHEGLSLQTYEKSGRPNTDSVQGLSGGQTRLSKSYAVDSSGAAR